MIYNNKFAPVTAAIMNSRKQNIDEMRDFCENQNDCRRQQLLRVLGQSYDRNDYIKNSNTTCDNCARFIQRMSLKRPSSGGSGQASKKQK